MERNHICKKCGGIAGWDSYYQSWICTRCGDYERKTITNADRIRAMTDEELAEVVKNPCDIGSSGPEGWCAGRNCWYQCSLDWLKEEVSE